MFRFLGPELKSGVNLSFGADLGFGTRWTVSNSDRFFRRTSSDNVVPKSSSVQKCSNTGCEQTAAYMCQGCNKAIYCGRNCQEEAWNNGHDSVCGEDDLESDPDITKEIST